MTQPLSPATGLSILPPVDDEAPQAHAFPPPHAALQAPPPQASLATGQASLDELRLRMCEQEAHRAIGLAERTEQQLHHAEANLNRARQVLASLGERPKAPTTPWLLVSLAAGAIALTFTLTLHDLVFAQLLPSTPVALFAGFVSAMLISGTLVASLIGSARLETRVSVSTGRGWLIVMLGIAAALFAMRWSMAHTVGAKGLAIGMSLLEAFLAISVERVADRLRHAWRQHVLDDEAWQAAARQEKVATLWREERRDEHLQAVTTLQGLAKRG